MELKIPVYKKLLLNKLKETLGSIAKNSAQGNKVKLSKLISKQHKQHIAIVADDSKSTRIHWSAILVPFGCLPQWQP